jgi:hypothetical protein
MWEIAPGDSQNWETITGESQHCTFVGPNFTEESASHSNELPCASHSGLGGLHFSSWWPFFLGGNTLDDNAKAFRGELDRFWRNYRKIDPTFPFFRDNSESCYEHCIPIALHGDEGRGRAKQPILVMSVQPLLPLNDGKTNMQGYLERMVIFPYSVMFFNIESKPKLIILYPSNMHPTKANFLHPAALHSAAFSILDEELPPSSVGPDQGFGIAGQRWICGSLWAYKIYTLYVLF